MTFSEKELGIIRVAIARELLRLDRVCKLARRKGTAPGRLAEIALDCADAEELWNKVKEKDKAHA